MRWYVERYLCGTKWLLLYYGTEAECRADMKRRKAQNRRDVLRCRPGTDTRQPGGSAA